MQRGICNMKVTFAARIYKEQINIKANEIRKISQIAITEASGFVLAKFTCHKYIKVDG
jgi:hypothetical protein